MKTSLQTDFNNSSSKNKENHSHERGLETDTIYTVVLVLIEKWLIETVFYQLNTPLHLLLSTLFSVWICLWNTVSCVWYILHQCSLWFLLLRHICLKLRKLVTMLNDIGCVIFLNGDQLTRSKAKLVLHYLQKISDDFNFSVHK